jgi:hypothetical protein
LRPGAPFRKKRRQLYLINLSSNFQTNFLTNKCENGDGGGCAEASVCGRCGDEGYVRSTTQGVPCCSRPKIKTDEQSKIRSDHSDRRERERADHRMPTLLLSKLRMLLCNLLKICASRLFTGHHLRCSLILVLRTLVRYHQCPLCPLKT